MALSKIKEIIKLQKEKEVHKHEPNFNLEAKVNFPLGLIALL